MNYEIYEIVRGDKTSARITNIILIAQVKSSNIGTAAEYWLHQRFDTVEEDDWDLVEREDIGLVIDDKENPYIIIAEENMSEIGLYGKICNEFGLCGDFSINRE